MKKNSDRVFRKEGAYDRYDFKDANEGIDKTVDHKVKEQESFATLWKENIKCGLIYYRLIHQSWLFQMSIQNLNALT